MEQQIVEIKCPKCKKTVERDKVVKKKYVCYECGYYFRVKTNNRIRMVADLKSFIPWFEEMPVSNPLSYEGYEEKLAETREKTGVKEAVTVGQCKIYGEDAVIGVCEARFMMGSMGHVVGEKITAAKDKVKSVIDAIKGFFNFKFSWPNIPTPKFSISPSGWKVGDLLKGSIPKLSIKWNALGGVFTKPTLTAYGASIQGLGEDGAEAIVPLEKNTKWLDIIADKLAARQSNTPVVLNVDGKTFAKTVINTVNDNTKQTGSLQLKLYYLNERNNCYAQYCCVR